MSELNNLLNKMNKYMLINENISLFKKDNNDILDKKKITDVKTINIDKNFFYINKPDPLFWCFSMAVRTLPHSFNNSLASS